MKQWKADIKRKVARLDTLEGTQRESEERWHSTLATLFQLCNPPGVFLTGSKLDAHPRTPGRKYKTGGSFGAQTVTVISYKSCGGPVCTHPPFLIPRKAQNQLPPPQSGSCLLQTASSSLANPPLSLHWTAGGKSHRQVTGPYSAWPGAREGLFPLCTRWTWRWLHRRRKHLPVGEGAVLLPPSCRWRRARKAPVPRPRAPLLSQQTGRAVKPQNAPCFWKRGKEANTQVLLFSKHCKILTWPLVRDIFCTHKTWREMGFQKLYPLTNEV